MSDDMDAAQHISGLDRQFEFQSPNQRQETASYQRDCDRNPRKGSNLTLLILQNEAKLTRRNKSKS